ncbi:hypothetical protein NLN92_23440 [Citrobacter portucalensis]|uniref:hypothetical protein n=1 Tax=Citrobacter portucalensis TaxID=1639133 RepID=UPI00226B092F|nr:hypothetical protein [Citrobacter portucalensis]MCX8980952.1 hypothetical protein [Citrobacter portucalensis]
MTKEYVVTPEFTIKANDKGQWNKADLAVLAAVALGAKIKSILSTGTVLVEMNEGNLFFITESVDNATLSKLSAEHNAHWFNPFISKPIAQELMRRFPMTIEAIVMQYGALKCEWATESNTQFGAGMPHMTGLLNGPDAWVTATSENPMEAITLNALYQLGLERLAAFHFPAGENSAELIYMTIGTAGLIQQNAQLAATTVLVPQLDKYSIAGVQPEEFNTELEFAKATLTIQLARWSKETGQPIPTYGADPETTEEAPLVDDKPDEQEQTAQH